MAFDPVKIPQDVQVEDRIIGPITLRHIIIIAIGAGISYAIWAAVTQAGPPSIPVTIFAWSPTVIAAAFAFIKINDLSLFKMILLMVEQAGKPNTRYWAQHSGISINFVTKPSGRVVDSNTPKFIGGSPKLAEMAQKLEEESRELATEGDDTHEKSPAPSLPVDRDRIVVDAFDTERSIDSL